MLEYEKEIFTQIVDDNVLVVLAKVCTIDTAFFFFLQLSIGLFSRVLCRVVVIILKQK